MCTCTISLVSLVGVRFPSRRVGGGEGGRGDKLLCLLIGCLSDTPFEATMLRRDATDRPVIVAFSFPLAIWTEVAVWKERRGLGE